MTAALTERELVIIDLFAGGGGASLGIEDGLGVGPCVAINHDDLAIKVHAANHVGCLHLCEDLLRVQPFYPRRKRGIDLVWGSPDCTHFANAKGSQPLESGRRILAWVLVEWARAVHPRIIILENIREFLDWGPLDEKGRPIEARKGETFREFVAALRLAGYRVEWRLLCAADYGAPTSRTRLFMVARCDGQRIAWPEPTHGPGCARPWRTAGECIDWSVPVRTVLGRKKPLAEATQRRIARGVQRFVIDNPRPYLLKRGEDGLLAPFAVTTSNGERPDQAPRVRDLERPWGTVCATGSQGALVAAFLAKHYGGGTNGKQTPGSSLDAPFDTVTARDHHGLVAAFLCKYYGQGTGQPLDVPLGTVTTLDRFGLVTVEGEPYRITDIGMRMLTPRELARAQGFPDTYLLHSPGPTRDKSWSKKAQIARIGNSVCPQVAAAVVQAQFGSTRAEPMAEAVCS